MKLKYNIKTYPSIFNDVIGPVMRGPSSSHCAAALRIGRLARDIMDQKIQEVLVEYNSKGSLATTHKSHGSDMGLFGGLLGWDATDPRLPDSKNIINEQNIHVQISIKDFGIEHPNTYRITLINKHEKHKITAISKGGGIIVITEIDGIIVDISGDYFETLIFTKQSNKEIIQDIIHNTKVDEIINFEQENFNLIEIKSRTFLEKEIIKNLNFKYDILSIKYLSPVLPILSRKDIIVPFITCEEMILYNKGKNLELWELALDYESKRGNLSYDQVLKKMQEIIQLIQDSIANGLKGTTYSDRILGYQSKEFKEKMDADQVFPLGMLNLIILYVSALMEIKSSMGVIVAAPTAGACGGLSGAVIGAANYLGLSLDEMAKAMLSAGLIGVFISAHATFAAEVGGCQAECGSGSGMAAAALVTLAKGTLKQSLGAASMALQNILGMICDPVANRVEVPCLGKNVMAASNAVTCANMALANYDHIIPLDEVINTMDSVGKSIPHELRCTALGGLSITETSKRVEKNLNSKKEDNVNPIRGY